MTCSTNYGKLGYISDFYSMAMVTLDMIISKETGELILNLIKSLSSKSMSGHIWLDGIKVIVK